MLLTHNFHARAAQVTAASMLVLALATAPSAHALPDAQFQPAFQAFTQANGGDSAAIDKAADAFAALLRAEPGNPVLMAYSGAATAMRASTTLLPWRKMGYAEDGLAQIDKALAMLSPAHDAAVQNHTPGVLETRFVAASVFLGVPGFMNRGERGHKLLADVQASPLFAGTPLGFRGAVWLKAAEVAGRDGKKDEARRLLNLVVQNQAPQAAQAQTRLQGLQS